MGPGSFYLINNVLDVTINKVMNVNDRNSLFLKGNIDREDLWPKVVEYESQALQFRFKFGLDTLPQEPGILFIRGPRQYGKSTWLEQELRYTLQDFGKGTAFFLNGDDLKDIDELEQKILELIPMFHRNSKVRRIFIDEITSIKEWEKGLKRMADRGELKDVLLITTGSSASDILRGSERMPGRKGKFGRTDYIFTGISYKDFHAQCSESFGEKTWIAYLLSGGSPIAAKEIWQFERAPEYFYEITKDWVLGELIKKGRSRPFLISLMRSIHRRGGTPTGFLKLAKDSGFSNNTLASEYIEQLSDILSVHPALAWDAEKETPLQRKPCKFHFVNLSVALAFSDKHMNSLHEFEKLDRETQGIWVEWLVAQELYRRQCIRGVSPSETLYYWQSKEHEVDFVDSERKFYEVKLGKTGPMDFMWFPKVFPKSKLLVISSSEFETSHVKGITLEQFLLADGFAHPYPGQVEDEDIYNDFARFNSSAS